MPEQGGKEAWGTRIGVILAVIGSAVGLGNFLRFPGLAAQYGGGAFMIPYVAAFLLLGVPMAWVEWTLGRYGGARGFNSTAGIYRTIWKNRFAPYLGVLGMLIPVMIYMYYVYVEGWCLAYAIRYLVGAMDFGRNPAEYGEFFGHFVGAGENGEALSFEGKGILDSALFFVGVCFVINFVLIYRGLTKGIEWFCKWAMPSLVVCALVVLVRVLTLGTPNPELPDQSLSNGLGYMWNPSQQADHLAPGDLAVEALVARSTAQAAEWDTASDPIESLRIVDAEAFAWALNRNGWNRAEKEEEESELRAETADLDGDWTIEDIGGSLRIEADAVTVRGAMTGDFGVAVDGLLAMLPRKVAHVERHDARFDTIAIDDEAGFREALLVTGWTPVEDEPRWRNPKSRLKLAVDADRATLIAPTFWQTLANPEMWLAAAGQIFFSLSVGFGIVITYASYMKKDDDIALSSLTAVAGNGFCEVVLGGLITIPAAFVFMGFSFVQNPPGTFSMGFVTLPNVFNEMPFGQFVGFLFFFLLFLAAVTSSLSMLQPAIALLEEGLGLKRKASVSLLGFITAIGAGFVVFFSKDLLALDTIDFWVGTFCIFVLATAQVILFGWVLGVDRGFEELDRGAEIRVPGVMKFIIKYVSPLYLLTVFALWFHAEFLKTPEDPTQVTRLGQLRGDLTVQLAVGLIAIVGILFTLLIAQSVKRWAAADRQANQETPE